MMRSFEAWFVSSAHSDADIESTIQIIEELKAQHPSFL